MTSKDYSKRFDPREDLRKDPRDYWAKQIALLALTQAMQTGREPFDGSLMPREWAERSFQDLVKDINRERIN